MQSIWYLTAENIPKRKFKFRSSVQNTLKNAQIEEMKEISKFVIAYKIEI